MSRYAAVRGYQVSVAQLLVSHAIDDVAHLVNGVSDQIVTARELCRVLHRTTTRCNGDDGAEYARYAAASEPGMV